MAPFATKIQGSLPGLNNNGGRKKSKEWNFVKKVDSNTYRCMFCNVIVSAKIHRIQRHIASCSEAQKNLTSNDTVHIENDNSSANSNTSMDRFVMRTTAIEKNDLDLAVARFFLASNIPFRQVENKHFLRLMDKLRRGYVPPKRDSLSEEYLDKIYMECKNDIASEFETTLQRGMAITLCQVIQKKTQTIEKKITEQFCFVGWMVQCITPPDNCTQCKHGR